MEQLSRSFGPGARTHEVVRGSIISLLRGSFACPVIATLAEVGVAERMFAGPFTLADFVQIGNRSALEAIFRYLQALGLIETSIEGQYALTTDGRRVFKRSGGFLLLHSYRDYFSKLTQVITGEATHAVVDRRQNVLGSGSLHSRKFFPAAWEMFGEQRPKALVDIGCGDGHFLTGACAQIKDLRIAAIDLSAVAVETTLCRLREAGRCDEVGIVASGEEVTRWLHSLPDYILSCDRLIISMWFVVHEFSTGDEDRVITFFKTLRTYLPAAGVLLGEITALSLDVMAENHAVSVMPEFLLFHELSGQGVLSWKAWQRILSKIPYRLGTERLFDVLGDTEQVCEPSSFLWHLLPE